ncbi:MAG: EF-hand domain-containing protein [Verrucomicrobiales bacterium]
MKQVAPPLRPILPAVAALAMAACQSAAPPDRFAQADRDGNGTLSQSEINGFLVGGIFEARDTNKDGKITKAEWNPQMDATEARDFERRDLNRDGVVTREEAVTYAQTAGVFAADIRAADTNKDGVISRAEATAYYASKE